MTWPLAAVIISAVLGLALLGFGFCLVAAVAVNERIEKAKREEASRDRMERRRGTGPSRV